MKINKVLYLILAFILFIISFLAFLLSLVKDFILKKLKK